MTAFLATPAEFEAWLERRHATGRELVVGFHKRATGRRLRDDDAACAFFNAQPPSYRRTAIHWVTSAKRPQTRERRLERLIEDSARSARLGPIDGRARA